MLYEKVYNSIIENSLVKKGDTVICAISGGADSVCLTDILDGIKDRLGITVECAHLNHNLRGRESDSDEEFVTRFCKKRNITLYKKSVDVSTLAKGRSIEEAARTARYTFFDELSSKENVIVATAHTQNDNIETFFINLVRGSGTKGLCGIPQVRGKIVRPMLDIKRCEIIEHLKAQDLHYCTDSTNSDTDYLRNFIRLNIIKEFEKRDDIDIFKSVSRAIANLNRDNSVIENLADNVCSFEKESLLLLDDAILYRTVAKKLGCEFGIVLDSVHFESIKALLTKQNGAKVQIRGDIFARIRKNNLEFFEVSEKSNDILTLQKGSNIFGETEILIENTKEIYNTLTKASINYDKIKGNLYVRTRREGDVFYSAKRKCTSSLKKLLSNDRVLPEKRDRLLIICDENGIVFVEGYGADSRYIANKDDKNIFCIKIRG